MKKINRFLLIILIILSFFTFSTIVYSAISSTFYIDGSSIARIEKDVRVTGFNVFNVSDGVLSSYEEYRVDGIKMGISLPNNSSYVTYKIQVTNYGNNDVIIKNINGLPSNLKYEISDYSLGNKICDNTGNCNLGAKKEFFITIKYSNYTGVTVYDLNLEFDFRTIYTVNYRYIENNGYPSTILEGETLNISFTGDVPRNINYIVGGSSSSNFNYSNGVFSSSEFNGDIIIEPGDLIRAISGNGTKLGDVVEIGDEAFYVMANDGEKLTLLAKYNLYVGGVYSNGTLTNYGSEATGLQDSSMVAWASWLSTWKGVTPYSTNGYWASSGSLNSKYGSSYPAYVYDSNSTIYPYVNNYGNYLKRIGADVLEARVPTYQEAINIGCVPGKDCKSAPSWFYATTFWLGSAYNNSIMYRISTDCYINWDTKYYDYARGVRPIIVVPTTSISANVTYDGITNNGYPEYVVYDSTLTVKFKNDIPSGVRIYVGGKLYDNYSYSNGVLEVFDVYDDIVISKDKKNTFEYTNKEETYVVDNAGVYRLEAWGAQGGTYNSSFKGGYGAYAVGEVTLSKGDTLYINFVGEGEAAPIPITSTFATNGGYNGGGRADATSDCSNFASGGGGASHIALVSGKLSTLESKKDKILPVAAGGGGSSSRYCSDSDWHHVSGGHGGGIQGDVNLIVANSGWPQQNPSPATQTTGGSPGHHNYEVGATAGTGTATGTGATTGAGAAG